MWAVKRYTPGGRIRRNCMKMEKKRRFLASNHWWRNQWSGVKVGGKKQCSVVVKIRRKCTGILDFIAVPESCEHYSTTGEGKKCRFLFWLIYDVRWNKDVLKLLLYIIIIQKKGFGVVLAGGKLRQVDGGRKRNCALLLWGNLVSVLLW